MTGLKTESWDITNILSDYKLVFPPFHIFHKHDLWWPCWPLYDLEIGHRSPFLDNFENLFVLCGVIISNWVVKMLMGIKSHPMMPFISLRWNILKWPLWPCLTLNYGPDMAFLHISSCLKTCSLKSSPVTPWFFVTK